MMEKTLLVALLVVCAYLNALLLAGPARAFRLIDGAGASLLIGVLISNGALMYWLRFDPLITVIVWLPGLAGIVARKLSAKEVS
jgi:hypothetical protein